MVYNLTTRSFTVQSLPPGTGGGGGDMTQAVHDVTDHATNYALRTTSIIISNSINGRIATWESSSNQFVKSGSVAAADSNCLT